VPGVGAGCVSGQQAGKRQDVALRSEGEGTRARSVTWRLAYPLTRVGEWFTLYDI